MEIDSEDETDGNKEFKLEHVSTTIEEVQNLVVTANANEVLCQKLLHFPSLKVSLASFGIKSTRMEQMLLLGKMDARRLKEKLENKNDCYAHECKHYGMLMKFQWKVWALTKVKLEEEVEAITLHVLLDTQKYIEMKHAVIQHRNV